MADDWQKSLRIYQSRQQTKNIQKRKISEREKAENPLPYKIKNHDETDKNLVGIPTNTTIVLGSPKRRKLSTREVITEPDSTFEDLEEPEKYFLSSIGDNYKFCFSILENENVFGDVQGEASQNSVPLGEGVTNIDPDDNNLIPYGKETFDYYQLRDNHFRLKTDDLLGYQGHLIFERRKRLVEWLIHVAHHNKCSQQTFYHTVDILDRSLSRKKFRPESIQLLGITSFFIASKLDEYYPADIGKLSRLTENSSSPEKIRAMERFILSLLDFEVYNVEPMIPINRFLKAANMEGDTLFNEIAIFAMDSLTLNLHFWLEKSIKKASASVLICMLVRHFADRNGPYKSLNDLWTANMKYYAWYNPNELIEMVIYSLEIMVKSMDNANEIDPNTKLYKTNKRKKEISSLTLKYNSVSQHNSLLTEIDEDAVKKALYFAKEC